MLHKAMPDDALRHLEAAFQAAGRGFESCLAGCSIAPGQMPRAAARQRIAGCPSAYALPAELACSCTSERFFALIVTCCCPRSGSLVCPPLTRDFALQICKGSQPGSQSGQLAQGLRLGRPQPYLPQPGRRNLSHWRGNAAHPALDAHHAGLPSATVTWTSSAVRRRARPAGWAATTDQAEIAQA